jgi:hypothetical protein
MTHQPADVGEMKSVLDELTADTVELNRKYEEMFPGD